MKKELLAGIAFVLLLVGAAANIHYLNSLTNTLNTKLDEVSQLCNDAEYEIAQDTLSEALDTWLARDTYTYVFIRHSEVDATTDAFYNALVAISNENRAEIQYTLAMLKKHLSSILDMERVTIRSVF